MLWFIEAACRLPGYSAERIGMNPFSSDEPVRAPRHAARQGRYATPYGTPIRNARLAPFACLRSLSFGPARSRQRLLIHATLRA